MPYHMTMSYDTTNGEVLVCVRICVHARSRAPSRQGLYPVNTLRNVALNNCRTDYLILADVDFVPNKVRARPVTSRICKGIRVDCLYQRE